MIINLILIFLYVCIALLYVCNELFYLQSEMYDVKIYLLGSLRRFIKNLFLYLCLVIGIVLFIFFLQINTTLIYILFGCLVIAFIFSIVIDFKIIKLKFTQRTFRIISLTTITIVLLFIFFHCLGENVFVLFMILLPLLLNFFIVVSVFVLKPIENIIGRKYIYKAKSILNCNVNLVKIGITGSYGKTSTKEILQNILSTQYYSIATPKSFNTPFGITKTINNDLFPAHEIFICEFGAKKIGEIEELCNLVDVQYGIITAVGRQHMNTFGSIDNIYSTKKELADYLKNKHCVFNLMNIYVSLMYKEYCGDKIGVFVLHKRNVCSGIKIVRMLHIKYAYNVDVINRYGKFFEFLKLRNVYAKNIISSEFGLSFDVFFGDEYICKANTVLIGEHNVINILLAVAMAKMLDVSNEKIDRGISKTSMISARFEKYITRNNALVINNGYNSNLDSAKYSFESLNKIDRKYKVVITPGLIDCKDSYDYNYKFGVLLSKYVTKVVIVKDVNKKAISDGLLSQGFDVNDIVTVKHFSETYEYIGKANSDYVILIENDLPDNFK